MYRFSVFSALQHCTISAMLWFIGFYVVSEVLGSPRTFVGNSWNEVHKITRKLTISVTRQLERNKRIWQP